MPRNASFLLVTAVICNKIGWNIGRIGTKLSGIETLMLVTLHVSRDNKISVPRNSTILICDLFEHGDMLGVPGISRHRFTQVGKGPMEVVPTPDTHDIVVMLYHFSHGLGLLFSEFTSEVLRFYRVQLVHPLPNSILALAIFAHL